MKKFYAWLLLVISTFQWIGGHICIEVVYSQEIVVKMTEPEQAISDAIVLETGMETSVNILPTGQHLRLGADYGNYFAYSLTDSTGTVFYTIDYSPRTVIWEQVAGELPNGQQEDHKATLLKKLFSEFLFPSHTDEQETPASSVASLNFSTTTLHGYSSTPPLTPPPDFYS